MLKIAILAAALVTGQHHPSCVKGCDCIPGQACICGKHCPNHGIPPVHKTLPTPQASPQVIISHPACECPVATPQTVTCVQETVHTRVVRERVRVRRIFKRFCCN